MLIFYNVSFCEAFHGWFMFGMNRHKLLKCLKKEKHDFRQAAQSSDRSYYIVVSLYCSGQFWVKWRRNLLFLYLAGCLCLFLWLKKLPSARWARFVQFEQRNRIISCRSQNKQTCCGYSLESPIPVEVILILHKIIIEPPHDKTNKMVCADSEDSDQPWHPPSLIRVFSVRMKKAWVISYLLSARRRPWSDWLDAQADLILRWVHSSFCWFCHAVAHVLCILIWITSKIN